MQTTSAPSGDPCYYYRYKPTGTNNTQEIEVPYAADNRDRSPLPKEPIKNTITTSLRDMCCTAACCRTAAFALKMLVQGRIFPCVLSAIGSASLWQVPTGVFIPEAYKKLGLVARRIAKLGVALAVVVPLVTYPITRINPLPLIEIGLSVNALALAWLDRYEGELQDLLAPDLSRAIDYEKEIDNWRQTYIDELCKQFPSDLEKRREAFYSVLGIPNHGKKATQAEVIEETSPTTAPLD